MEAAEPLAYCADADVTGAEFYVMEYVDGQVLSDRDAGLALAPEARATAGEQVIDGVRARYASGRMADDGYRQQALKRGDDGIQLAEAARDVLRELHVQ